MHVNHGKRTSPPSVFTSLFETDAIIAPLILEQYRTNEAAI
ncbi:hypothetical protein [Draconibacterium sediminis]|nr:hypothetical protein [Draconibacterium sediminis]